MADSTCPPLVVEKILAVPPHCFTYHKNQRADTSWGSEVTSTFTNRVAKLLAALQQRRETVALKTEERCQSYSLVGEIMTLSTFFHWS